MSLFVWYFGTRPPLRGRRRTIRSCSVRAIAELLDDIFERKVLAKDFSLYLHRPTATDPSLAPPGCDAFYVLSPVPHLDGDIDWATQAEPYRQAIASVLDATVLPGLERARRDLARDDAAGFPGSAVSFRARRSAWSRCCCRAPGSGRTTSEDIDELLSGRRRHASRRRGAGGAVVRQGSRHGGSGSACLRASGPGHG